MFINRQDAADQLIKKLDFLRNNPNIIVLAVPRGGLPIGAAVAAHLQAPLDVVLAKKISAPGNPEFAIGAATPTTFFIEPEYDVPAAQEHIAYEVAHVQTLLKKRDHQYHQHQAPQSLAGKMVIIVDDGVATGHTLLAALLAVKKQQPQTILIATPVITPQAVELFKQHGAQVVSVLTPQHLQAIGQFYQDFSQVSDEQALHILQQYQKK